MYLDLKEVPFSTRGSYMAVSYHEKNFRGSGMEEGPESGLISFRERPLILSSRFYPERIPGIWRTALRIT